MTGHATRPPTTLGSAPPIPALRLIAPPCVHSGRPAGVRLGGLAIDPCESYWSSFNARMPPRPPLSVITHVDLEEVDCPPNGKFLSPTFRRVRNLTREEAQPLIDERKRRVAEWRSLVAEDVSSGATREAPTAAGPEPGSSPDGTYAAEGFDGEEAF